jgi:hypothetical protein
MSYLLAIKPYLMYISMYGLGISLIVGLVLGRCLHGRRFRLTDGVLQFLFFIAYAEALYFAWVYLLHPIYIDHVEPTIATLGLRLQQGEKLYPPVDAYTFHGILYGPLMAELEYLIIGVTNDVIFDSKLPAVFSFFIFVFISIFGFKKILARGYLLLIIPFGFFMIWTRAEPLLLLMCAVSWMFVQFKSRWQFLLLGLVAGLSFSLKIHAILYVLPFFILAISNYYEVNRSFATPVFVYVVSFFISIFFIFGMEQVSWLQYFEYLRLASSHGFSYSLFEKNMIYLGISWIPLLMVYRCVDSLKGKFLLAAVFVLEVLILVAGSKPGSGVHHYMPCLFVNACLIEVFFETKNEDSKFEGLKYALILLAIYIVLFDLPKLISGLTNPELKQKQGRILRELTYLNEKYPGAMMGVSSGEHAPYSSTFYRVILKADKAEQTDVAAYMDYNFSGVSDLPFVKALKECKSNYLFLPKEGAPFSILNFYTQKPLFSDAVRSAFEESYIKEYSGEEYEVYSCYVNK